MEQHIESKKNNTHYIYETLEHTLYEYIDNIKTRLISANIKQFNYFNGYHIRFIETGTLFEALKPLRLPYKYAFYEIEGKIYFVNISRNLRNLNVLTGVQICKTVEPEYGKKYEIVKNPWMTADTTHIGVYKWYNDTYKEYTLLTFKQFLTFYENELKYKNTFENLFELTI